MSSQYERVIGVKFRRVMDSKLGKPCQQIIQAIGKWDSLFSTCSCLLRSCRQLNLSHAIMMGFGYGGHLHEGGRNRS